MVFEYLTMLQAVGPQEWFYKELQTVEETSFRWKEQVWIMFILMTVCEMFEYFLHYLFQKLFGQILIFTK